MISELGGGEKKRLIRNPFREKNSGALRMNPSTDLCLPREALRKLPEGMSITPVVSLDTIQWIERSDMQLTQKLRLVAQKDGYSYGKLTAEKRIERNPANPLTEKERYVYLATLLVQGGGNEENYFPKAKKQAPHGMRKRGIGSALLQELENQAREFGATRIEGRVINADIIITPDLLSFYQKRGYVITPIENMYKIENLLEKGK